MIDLFTAGCGVVLAGAGFAAIRLADRWLPGRHCDLCHCRMPGGWARFARRRYCEECAGLLHKAGANGQYQIATRAASNARIAGLTDQAVRDAIERALQWDHNFRRQYDSVVGLQVPGDPPDE